MEIKKMEMLKYYKIMEMINKYGFNTVVLMSFAIMVNLFVLYIIANIIKDITKNREVNFIIENAPINYTYKDRKENHKKGDKDFYEIDYYNTKPL